MSLGLSFDLEELISDGMVIARKINLQKKKLRRELDVSCRSNDLKKDKNWNFKVSEEGM